MLMATVDRQVLSTICLPDMDGRSIGRGDTAAIRRPRDLFGAKRPAIVESCAFGISTLSIIGVEVGSIAGIPDLRARFTTGDDALTIWRPRKRPDQVPSSLHLRLGLLNMPSIGQQQ